MKREKKNFIKAISPSASTFFYLHNIPLHATYLPPSHQSLTQQMSVIHLEKFLNLQQPWAALPQKHMVQLDKFTPEMKNIKITVFSNMMPC
jgi:hypothetical protein